MSGSSCPRDTRHRSRVRIYIFLFLSLYYCVYTRRQAQTTPRVYMCVSSFGVRELLLLLPFSRSRPIASARAIIHRPVHIHKCVKRIYADPAHARAPPSERSFTGFVGEIDFSY